MTLAVNGTSEVKTGGLEHLQTSSMVIAQSQNALHIYYSQAPGKPGASDIVALLQSGYNSSGMVFLVTETERTREACVGVLRVLEHTQEIVSEHNASPVKDNPWSELNVTMGRAMREFQNAARAELNVKGPESSWIERGQGE